MRLAFILVNIRKKRKAGVLSEGTNYFSIDFTLEN